MRQPILLSTLAPGELITDRLVVQRCIGAGGLGEVYEVLHKFTKHRRAVKVLHAIYRRDAELVDRLLREASAAGRIGNPHIVETFDAGHLDDGSPFIVMEFLEGKSLKEVLLRHGRFDGGLAAAVVSQVCTAIQAAHDAGIIHRDLKPENLFLTEREGRAFIKVVDFGISKFQADEGELFGSTRTGATMGTPRYMAPEQLRGAKNADIRSDVYSLGVVLYELVSGAVPFDADSFVELAMKVLGGQHQPLHLLDGAIPRELSTIVDKAMRLSPKERFQSARELSEALAPFVRNRSVRVLLGTEGEEGEATPPEGALGGQLSTACPAKPPPRPLDDAPSLGEAPSGPGPRGSGRLWAFALLGGLPLVLGGLGVFAWRHWASVSQTILPDRASQRLRPVAVEEPSASTVREPSRGLTAPASGPLAVPPPVVAPAGSPRAPSSAPPVGPVVSRTPAKKAAKRERVRGPAAIEAEPSPMAPAEPSHIVPAEPSPMAPADPSPELGVVDIACQPVPCTVMVDGESLGETPLLNRQLPAGQHEAVLVNTETGASETRTFEVNTIERTKLMVEF